MASKDHSKEPASTSNTSSTAAAQKAADNTEVKVDVPQGAPVIPDPTVGPKDPPKMVDLPPGELKPGETGIVPLSPEGEPQGDPKHADKADPNSPHATVRREPESPDTEVRTPAGAPVTNQMNPAPNTVMDDGFLARNPPGGTHDSDAAVPASGIRKDVPEANREANAKEAARLQRQREVEENERRRKFEADHSKK